MTPPSISFPAHSVITLSVKALSSLPVHLSINIPPPHLSQIAGGIIGTLSIIVYGQIIRRPPIPLNRIASLASVASAGGVIGGTVVRANAHADFFRNLDNRPAFFQAIDNIQSRLGEKPAGQHADPAYSYPGSDNENQETADGALTSRGPWEESTVDVNKAILSPNPSIVTRPVHLSRHLSFFGVP